MNPFRNPVEFVVFVITIAGLIVVFMAPGLLMCH